MSPLGGPAVRCGVRGSPVEHSLSPVLHRAAYQALGLTAWSYDRVRVEDAELAAHVRGLDESWRGLSLTMPLKEAAFGIVREASALAVRVGAINTLLHDPHGWTGHNTDVHGIVAAIREGGTAAPRSAVVVGSGATARSAVAALAELGAAAVGLMVRDGVRPRTAALSAVLGLDIRELAMGHWPFGADVVIGTIPAAGYAGALGALPSAPDGAVILDCVYGDGPSPLLGVGRELGYAAVPGTVMLLHQAAEQVRLMTGRPAPVEAMRAALAAALDD